MEKIKNIVTNYKLSNELHFNDFAVDIEKQEEAVFFLYCSWSPIKIDFMLLLDTIKRFPAVKLYILDIDEPDFQTNKFPFRSNGWGEIYLIYQGAVVGEIGKDKNRALLAKAFSRFF